MAEKKTTTKKTTAATGTRKASDRGTRGAGVARAARTKATAAPAAPAATAAPVKKTTAARRRATVSKAAAPISSVARHKSRRRTKVGMVVSTKSAKTAVVEIERLREHPLYKKATRVRKKFASHVDGEDVREGDLVRIEESRPYSATKRWRVIEVISRAGEAGAAAPKVAEIEKALEEAEGVSEIFARPERPERPAEQAEAEDEAEPEGRSEA
ncbi:MAG TPA: 30S ribosomal protein S17 [Candidatus Limnocylindria bacterium]|nr:30S ribosomal protein S17 [Candidatus Limnocylindria bacterium]